MMYKAPDQETLLIVEPSELGWTLGGEPDFELSAMNRVMPSACMMAVGIQEQTSLIAYVPTAGTLLALCMHWIEDNIRLSGMLFLLWLCLYIAILPISTNAPRVLPP